MTRSAVGKGCIQTHTAGRAPQRKQGAAANQNVLVVSHYYPPHIGGIEIVAQGEAQGLSRLGCNVKVLTSGCGTNSPQLQPADGVAVTRHRVFNGFEKFGVPFPVFSPAFVMSAWRLIRWAHLVHIHDTLYVSSWVAALICRVLRRPYVITKHVGFVAHQSRMVGLVQSIVNGLIGAYILSHAATVFAINPIIESYLVAKDRRLAEKTRVLLNGVDTRRFRPARSTEEVVAIRRKHGLPVDSVLVLFVGRFVSKKRVSVVLDCESTDYRMVIVGGSGTESVSSDNGHIFLGTMGRDALAEIYRAVDIFVCPSIGEYLPLTVLEAMASGAPAIVEDNESAGDPAFAERGIVAVRDIDRNLAPTLSELANSHESLRAMSNAAVWTVSRFFSLTNHMRQLKSSYDKITARNHGN